MNSLIEQVKADVEADRLIQGDYWNGKRGCFVGCLRKDSDHTNGGPLNAPEWFWRLMDRCHEGVLPESIGDNYVGVVTAVVNADFKSWKAPRWQEIFHKLMARIQRRNLSRVDRKANKQVYKAIQQVISYHENPNRTEEERESAANAAWSAAANAAWSAAANAAWSAAWSAAGNAAWSAAESAAWSAAESAAWSAVRVEYQQIVEDFIELCGQSAEEVK